MTVDVVIPSYHPGEKFLKLLSRLEKQETPVNRIIVVNTEEEYWKPDQYERFSNLEVHHIAKSQFDHGAARNLGISYSEADIVVCMTDDAMPADQMLITSLLEGFSKQGPEGELVIEVYGRQLPGKDCSTAEQYTRQFNYPEQGRIKTIKDLDDLGIKTYFASNVCCAYRRELFEKLGGFTEKTIFNEDMIFAAKALKAGYAVCYAADARVVHSHNYTALQQLHRNFDLGVSQADHPEVFSDVPSEGEGFRLVRQTVRYLSGKRKFLQIPGLIVNSGCKYIGYRLGKQYRRLPKKIVRQLSMNKHYWDR